MAYTSDSESDDDLCASELGESWSSALVTGTIIGSL